jgi:hypothetical protein
MPDESDQFDEIVDDLGLGDETDEPQADESEIKDSDTSQDASLPTDLADSLGQLLTAFDQGALTDVVAALCQARGWTTEVTSTDSSGGHEILARKFLPHPESVRLVAHTASRVTADTVAELLSSDTPHTTTKYTIIVSEPPTDSALEWDDQQTIEVVGLDDLARDVLAQGLTDRVVQHATADEQIAAAHEDALKALEASVSQSAAPDTTTSEPAAETEEATTDTTQTTVVGEGDYIDIEVVGFDNEYIEYEDRDTDLLEERKYTVICLYVENKTSYEWEFQARSNLAVVSAEGFSHDNPQNNGWSDRTEQFTPWNNGRSHDIKPNSKARVVVIYQTWFEPERIEYTADLLHVHGGVDVGGDLSDKTERISIEIDESARNKMQSLPDSLPIDSVVLN